MGYRSSTTSSENRSYTRADRAGLIARTPAGRRDSVPDHARAGRAARLPRVPRVRYRRRLSSLGRAAIGRVRPQLVDVLLCHPTGRDNVDVRGDTRVEREPIDDRGEAERLVAGRRTQAERPVLDPPGQDLNQELDP